MTVDTRTIAQVVEAVGGIAELARLLDVAVSTVAGWLKGRNPGAWNGPRLAELHRKRCGCPRPSYVDGRGVVREWNGRRWVPRGV